MSLFGFVTNPTVAINFDGQNNRETKKMRVAGHPSEDIVVYSGDESIVGTVEISVPSGKRVDHLGIKIEMIGQIGKLLYF